MKKQRYERYDIPGFGTAEIWSDVPAETCANRDVVKLTSHISYEDQARTSACGSRKATRHALQVKIRRNMSVRLAVLEHEAEMLRCSLVREPRSAEEGLAWLKKYQTKGNED